MTPNDSGLMRAWLTSGDGIADLAPARIPVPAPGATEVLVRVTGLALNYRDLLVINGIDTWKPVSPVVPISDAAGVVVEAGPGVTRFDVGDRLLPAFLPRWRTGPLTTENQVLPVGGPVNRGFLAEYTVIDEQEAVSAPQHLTDTEAATLPVAGVTAWHSLARTGLSPDEVVLVHGTGGVALFALQIAHARGARVIITSSDETKLERARALGAWATVNYKTHDVSDAVHDLTDGRGADAVVETVGGQNLNVSLAASAIGARIALVGLIGGQSAPVDTYRFVQRHVTVHGIETGSREILEQLVAFTESERLRPVLDETFPVGAVRDALTRLQGGGHFGKVTLDANGGW